MSSQSFGGGIERTTLTMSRAKYIYKPLKSDPPEIRVLQLLPGKFDDPLWITLDHAELVVPEAEVSQRMSLEELQQTLPEGWKVYETTESRALFANWEDGYCSWKHPDAKIDERKYAQPPIYPPQHFEPRYEALSYTWGSGPEIEAITVQGLYSLHDDDRAGFSTLQVRKNLAQALRYLRQSDVSRSLWIDAVCINQDDTSEKSNQIPLMRDIYTLAQRTVVWLGVDSTDSRHAITTLRDFSAQIELTARDFRRFPAPQARENRWHNSDVPLPYNSDTWNALSNLLERPWFNRLWIWQEIRLSNRLTVVHCGHDKICWSQICPAIIAIRAKRTSAPTIFMKATATKVRLSQDHRDTALLSIISHSSRLHCSEPRDKIYGLLGLTTPKFSNKVQIDYSLTVAAVYQQAARACIDLQQRLDILQWCDLTKRCPGGPSWVPNWSHNQASAGLSYFPISSGLSSAQVKYNSGMGLEAMGLLCGKVDEIVVSFPEDLDEFVPLYSKILPKDVSQRTYPTGESLLDAFLLTIQLNLTAERSVKNTIYPPFGEWKEQYLSHVASSQEPLSAELFETSNFYKSYTYCQSRVFITTASGYVGLAPSGTSVGDMICVFLGCCAPIVLRPIAPGEFLVVGESYVHGLNDAIPILGSLPPGWRVVFMKDNEDTMVSPHYYNSEEGIYTNEDPRLGPLPPGWERIERRRNPNDPYIFDRFKNQTTGDVINSDPRMLPDALRARGVKLDSLLLV